MLDDSTRAAVNRAIEDALRPRGMSIHDGKARLDTGMLQRLVVMIDRGAEALLDAQARIAELERETVEQARLLGISGSTEARLLARVGELERDVRERQSEQAVLSDILRDCDAVLSTIEPENTDEDDSLGDLRRAIAYAICPYKDDDSLLEVTKRRYVTYVCPVCAASLERQE